LAAEFLRVAASFHAAVPIRVLGRVVDLVVDDGQGLAELGWGWPSGRLYSLVQKSATQMLSGVST
jgi:hypothetical protein